MTDIASLLARARQATGPDREIDIELSMLGKPNPGVLGDKWFSGHDEVEIVAYTSDLNAIIDLIEATLPGWTWGAHSPRRGTPYEGVVSEGREARRVCVDYAPTICVALVCAFLQAWESAK